MNVRCYCAVAPFSLNISLNNTSFCCTSLLHASFSSMLQADSAVAEVVVSLLVAEDAEEEGAALVAEDVDGAGADFKYASRLHMQYQCAGMTGSERLIYTPPSCQALPTSSAGLNMRMRCFMSNSMQA